MLAERKEIRVRSNVKFTTPHICDYVSQQQCKLATNANFGQAKFSQLSKQQGIGYTTPCYL